MMMASKLSAAPPVEVASWASVWSAAVAVNEICVKHGIFGNAKPPSEWNVLAKPLSLPNR